MVSAKRSPGKFTMIALLACLAGVLGLSVPGCSGGGGPATRSPEDRARLKEVFKKRFQNFGEKTDRKSPR
jgi:hypothetical protein